MFLELKLHDVVNKKSEKDIKKILDEIDKILEELPPDKKKSYS